MSPGDSRAAGLPRVGARAPIDLGADELSVEIFVAAMNHTGSYQPDPTDHDHHHDGTTEL